MGHRLCFVLVMAGVTLAGVARAEDGPNETRAPTLVHQARLTLVADLPDVLPELKKLVESCGGRLLGAADNLLTFDVPRESYRNLVSRLWELGEVRSEQLSTEDVTDAVAEKEAAARAARRSRDQIERVTSLAHGTEEHLMVERELEAATEEVTQSEAAQRELLHRAEGVHVTLALELPPREAVPSPTLPFGWLGELGLERLGNTEPPAPEPHRVLRSFVDVTTELRLTHMAHAAALDGVTKSGAAGMSVRALGEAAPVGLFGGMDLELGASRGFLYGLDALGGAGVPIGSRFAVGFAAGPGIDGITSVLPFGVDLPLELYFSFDLAPPVAASAWVRDGWVFAAKERRHGSSHAPFGDELSSGVSFHFGTRREPDSYTSNREGIIVGFAYREAMDARFYELRIGYGAHEADFSQAY